MGPKNKHTIISDLALSSRTLCRHRVSPLRLAPSLSPSLSVCLSVCLSVRPPVRPSVCPSVCLSVWSAPRPPPQPPPTNGQCVLPTRTCLNQIGPGGSTHSFYQLLCRINQKKRTRSGRQRQKTSQRTKNSGPRCCAKRVAKQGKAQLSNET